jgi:outer membrane protein assembly factor BamB
VTGAVLAGNSLYFETSEFKRIGEKNELQLHIVALHAQTGTALWSTSVELLDGTEKTSLPPPNSRSHSSGGYGIDMAPVASKDAVYYSTPGSRISVLRPSDGTILEQFWVDKTDQTTVQDRVVLFVVP